MNPALKKLCKAFYAADQKVSTDSRKIIPGSVFFALKGEHFNGNLFAEQALQNGALWAIADERKFPDHEKIIIVDNVLESLQQLANLHRKKLLQTKFIALTGSNGKTTTKELIHSVLSQKFNSASTIGNLNNHIGVPLTLLSVRSEHKFAVIEMGANHQKEIEQLCSIAEPDFGLITNIGKAHLEGFGGLEGVKKGKGELYEFLRKSNRTIFINDDNLHLKEMAGDYFNLIKYGISENNFVSGVESGEGKYLSVEWRCQKHSGKKFRIQSKITGSYNLENILAAICLGIYFETEPERINHAIENYVPSNQRSQIEISGSNTLILDYYNANPTSMEAALRNFEKNFSTPPFQKKIAILGDMLELGNEATEEHERIGNLIAEMHFDESILVGKEFSGLSGKLNSRFYISSEKAAQWIKNQDFKNCAILIKGSRGIALEKIADALRKA